MRLVFCGTPEFAVPGLQALVAVGHDVTAVVTRPDRPKGRGGRLQSSPVKEAALTHALPVCQLHPKDPAFLAWLTGQQPEVLVVVAYGHILSGPVLQAAPGGAVNVHASLLPAYRGAAPVQRAILNGERSTGVTTMYMDPGMDTGDIILQEAMPIRDEDDAGTLLGRLAESGALLLVRTLAGLGALQRLKQDEAKVSYASPLTPADEVIHWAEAAAAVVNRVRALSPRPGAYTIWQGRRLKIWRACQGPAAEGVIPGRVVRAGAGEIVVGAGDGTVSILELQAEGGKRLTTDAFLRGSVMGEGAHLG
ncbi:MAG TPA: methionyl-tRNA formyltransferase [Spirochaetia bacterium]|nr:methionyl-tRNA formyltransferase [Spirochaetia bacterium]